MSDRTPILRRSLRGLPRPRVPSVWGVIDWVNALMRPRVPQNVLEPGGRMDEPVSC